MNHRYWRKQQAYIENREREQQAYVENSLLADRKNERRHQAILEALRAVGPVIANWSAGYKGTMMTGVSTRMEKGPQQVHPMAHDQVAFETALAGLHERLTEAESAVIHRLYDPAEEQIHYYQSVRDLLTSLLG